MRLRRGSKFKVKGLRGLCPDALRDSSRFSDLKVRATQGSMTKFKVKGLRGLCPDAL